MIRRIMDLVISLAGILVCLSLILEVIIPLHVMNVVLKVNKTQHHLLHLMGKINVARYEKRIINELTELNVPNDFIIDPFSCQPLIYDSTNDAQEFKYFLISVGPDGVRNLNQRDKFIIYDPTNGIYSEGDMAVTESALLFRDLGLSEKFGIPPSRR